MGHTPSAWVKDDPGIIGGSETVSCLVCNEIIEERDEPRETPNNITVLSSEGLTISKEDYMHHLISFLPEDVVICTDNRFNDNQLLDSSTFAITEANPTGTSDYVRVCYYDADYLSVKEPLQQHIDIYFFDADNFNSISKDLFASIDPEFANSDSFEEKLSEITTIIENKTEEKYSVEMVNGYFLYHYTTPYEIGGKKYPGFHEVRFLTKEFYNQRYGQ